MSDDTARAPDRFVRSDGRSLSAFELKVYARAGLGVVEAAQWSDAGIGPYEAEVWRAAGVDLPTARRWQRRGVTGQDYLVSVRAGRDASAALEQRDASSPPPAARTDRLTLMNALDTPLLRLGRGEVTH
jgi:hypothetical protein